MPNMYLVGQLWVTKGVTCVRVHACVCACVRACGRAGVTACACVCQHVFMCACVLIQCHMYQKKTDNDQT